MNVTPVTTSSSANPTPAPSQKPMISSDFNMFLRMLTVQMQNQDPLNPIESTDYAVQLATFSGVEQQVRTNELLAGLQTRFAQMGLSEMASWVGQEVRSDAAIRFDGTPVQVLPNPAANATEVALVVRNASGALVSRETMPLGKAPYLWLGADATGSPLPPGTYALSVESRAGDRVLATTPVEHYAKVVEARTGTAGTTLILEGGVEVAADRVTGLRAPQG